MPGKAVAMRMLGFTAFFVLVLFASSAESAVRESKEYQGTDTGYLIYSVGKLNDTFFKFDFSYSPTALDSGQIGSEWQGTISPKITGAFRFKIKNPDYIGAETGHVVVRRLPPGTYAVNRFDFYTAAIYSGTTYAYSSAVPFALPFTIRPGEATYIGRFMREYDGGKSFKSVMNAISPFIVADRSGVDWPIAKSRLPQATPLKTDVFDVSIFRTPMLRNEVAGARE